MSEGYVLIAIGDKYLELAQNLITTLRANGDERDVFVLTEVDEDELYLSAKTEFERKGTIPKITIDKYLPFDHNIFLDADSLCVADTQHVWDRFKANEQPIQTFGSIKERDKFWLLANGLYEKEQGYMIPKIHSGIMYFNRNTIDVEMFEWMREYVFPNYTDIFHSHPLSYKDSRPDQEIYQLAFGKFGYHVDEIWEQDCITVVNQNISLPTRQPWFKHRGGDEMEHDIPFVHILGAPEKPIYQSILRRYE